MHNIGIQVKRKKITKTFKMIVNWRKIFGRLVYIKNKYIFQRFNC